MEKPILTIGGALLLLVGCGPSLASTAAPASNPEMKRIYDADQADRLGNPAAFDEKKVGPRDALRRQRTGQLLADHQLHTGADFVEASYVYQHGGTPNDFLLAHTLAVIAVKKGDKRGLYIAAASLDRYLQWIGQKQIYGTQTTSQGGGQWTKAPYDRDTISDALREELTVPVLAAQDAQVSKMNAQAVPTAQTASPPANNASLVCDAGPVDTVFLRAKWHIFACNTGALMAIGDGAPPAMILVTAYAGKTSAVVTQVGGDAAESDSAKAAFEAMTPAQIEDLGARARAQAGATAR